MKYILASLYITLSIISISCKSQQKASDDSTDAADAIVATDILKDIELEDAIVGEWQIIEINDKKISTTDGDSPYVTFEKDATNHQRTNKELLLKCYAYNGCNYINGDYVVSTSGQINKASEFIATMQFCPDAIYEADIANALNHVKRYKIEKSEYAYILYFVSSDNKILMVVQRRYDTNFINGAWQVVSIAGAEVAKEKKLQIVIDIPEMKVHGSAGCNVLNGKLVIKPNSRYSLQFKEIATTRMACPDMELERQFINALNATATATPGESVDTVTLNDADGNQLVKLQRITLK